MTGATKTERKLGLLNFLVMGGLLLAASALAAAPAESAASLPQALSGAAVVYHGSLAFIFGGQKADGTASTAIFAYNPSTETLSTRTATLPSPGFWGSAAVSIGNYIYLAGGTNGTGAHATFWRYDPTEDAFEEACGNPTLARSFIAGTTDGATFFLAGGFKADGTPSGEFETYIPSSATMSCLYWNPAGESVPATGAAQAVVEGGYLYLLGGKRSGGYEDDIVKLNIALATYTVDGALPTPLAYSGIAWSHTDAYLYGGLTTGDAYSDDIISYEPDGSASTTSDSLPTARGKAGATWGQGHSIIVGGESSGGKLDEILHHTP